MVAASPQARVSVRDRAFGALAGEARPRELSARQVEPNAALFPTGRSGMRKINVGAWRDDRDEPMQVVSGPTGKQRVHYEAPPADRVHAEMEQFLNWFAEPGDMDALLIAGLAHLWFVTIHPFDDGNGRIARAIADMTLARSEQTGQRFYSMSAQITRERNEYYTMLERTQKGELDVTPWQGWFLNCLLRAIEGAGDTLGAVLAKGSVLPIRFRRIGSGRLIALALQSRTNSLGAPPDCVLDSRKLSSQRQFLDNDGNDVLPHNGLCS